MHDETIGRRGSQHACTQASVLLWRVHVGDSHKRVEGYYRWVCVVKCRVSQHALVQKLGSVFGSPPDSHGTVQYAHTCGSFSVWRVLRAAVSGKAARRS